MATAMKIYAIEHVQLAMPAGEEDKARAFYTPSRRIWPGVAASGSRAGL
jgi:hypothetical protein